MKKTIKELFDNLLTVLKKPEMLILPGSFAFFIVLSIVPTLTIITYVASFFNLSTNFIFEAISKALNGEVANLIVNNFGSNDLGIKFYLSLIVAFFVASNGAASVIATSNSIYGIKDSGFLRRRIKALIMTIILTILITFMLAIPVFGNKIVDLVAYVNMNPVITNRIRLIIMLLQGPISWFVIFALIKYIYTMAPDKKIPSKYVNYGAIFTSFCWIIVTAVFSYYISNFAVYDVFYGGLSNIVILMIWVYLLSYVFTIGMALNYRKEEIKLEKTGVIKTIEE